MQIARRIGGLVTIVLLLLLPAVAAHAYAPDGGDFVTCVAGEGASVDCVAGRFAPGCDVEATTSTGFEDVLVANAIGNVTFAFDIPAGADGDVTVILACGEDGAGKVLTETIGTAQDGTIIATAGTDTGLLAGAAVLGLLLGGSVLGASRRRPTPVRRPSVDVAS